MTKGDLIEWEWMLGNNWEPTRFTGVILSKSIKDLSGEGYFIFHVMSNDGVVEVRSDTTVMRMIARHANEDSPVV